MDRSEKVGLVILALLLVLPFMFPGYLVRVVSFAMVLSAMALSQNILLGYTGYPAFGCVAFFGIGGYSTAFFMKNLGISFLPSVLLGGTVALLIAAILAVPLMRLKSHYFAITTLALQLALGEFVANVDALGGAEGINLPIYTGPGGYLVFYFLFWIVMAVVFGLNMYIHRSNFGYAFKAIREDELAAEVLGVDTVKFKAISFCLMALFTALTGSIYSYWITYIDTSSMFDPLLSVKVFVALLLGGLGSPGGPIVGAFILEIVSELMWSEFPRVHGVILGMAIVLIMVLMPGGLRLSR